MVTQAQGATIAGASGAARANSVTQGQGSMPRAQATRLVNSPVVINGVGSMPQALPKARARAGAIILVNQLSQDDVTGAVMESVVEDGLTLRQAMRLVLAYIAGDATNLDTNPVFKSQDGSITRLAGTITGGTRTITTKDAS